MGQGYTGRFDRFNTGGQSSFEMHVFDKNGKEVGVYGPKGWINKHGHQGAPAIPKGVEKTCQNIAEEQILKQGGISSFINRFLKRMTPMILAPGLECMIAGQCDPI